MIRHTDRTTDAQSDKVIPIYHPIPPLSIGGGGGIIYKKKKSWVANTTTKPRHTQRYGHMAEVIPVYPPTPLLIFTGRGWEGAEEVGGQEYRVS